MERLKQLLESKGSILCTTVAVENQSIRWSAFFISCPKGGCDKLAAVLLRNFAGEHFTGIEVENRTISTLNELSFLVGSVFHAFFLLNVE